MKNKLYILAFILSIFCVFLASCNNEVTTEDFNYKIADKKVEIQKYIGDNEIVRIPDTFGNINAIVLDEKAFVSAKDVKEVYIPATVEEIEGNPFRDCISLKKIVVDENNKNYCSVNGILYTKDRSVLICCPAYVEITSLDLAGVVEVVDFACEKNATLTHLTIPSSVMNIGKNAFSQMESLAEISIDEGLETIGDFCFSKNPQLKNIKLPASLKEMGVGIFENCASLSEAKFVRNEVIIPERAFYNCKLLSKLPEGNIKEIKANAFNNCDSLEELSVPSSVSYIGDHAFDGCDNLKKIDLGNATFGEYAFANCSKLVEVHVEALNGEVPKYGFYSCVSLEKVTFGESIKKINSYAFAYSAVKSIIIPDGVEEIGGSVFLGCASLKTFQMTDSVETVGSYLFYDCSSLEKVELSEKIKTIPEYFFCRCLRLKDVNIPRGLETVERYAFFCCRALGDVSFPETLKTISENSFDYCDSFVDVKLPKSLKTIKKEAFAHSKRLNSIEIPEGVETIGDNVFMQSDLLSVVYVVKDSKADKWAKANNTGFEIVYS